VPWCDPCDRFYNPNSMKPDGTCPTCGTKLAEPPAPDARSGLRSVPWHFWVVVAALVLYLGWRAVQAVLWVVGRI